MHKNLFISGKPCGNDMLPAEYDISVRIAERFENILPPAGIHPRLYIRESDIDELRVRAGEADSIAYKKAYNRRIRELAKE